MSGNLKRRTVYAATDGTFSYKTYVGAWAYVTTKEAMRAGAVPKGRSSNRMELLAVLYVLMDYPDTDVHIYCDSMFVVRGIKEKLKYWRSNKFKGRNGKPIAHNDLWKQIDIFTRGRTVTIEHVHGHSGHELNEAADKLADLEREKYEFSTVQNKPKSK